MFEIPQDHRAFYTGETGGFSDGFFPFDPALHKIRKTDFTDFLNRELKTEGALVVYWHTESLNWVITLLVEERGMPGLHELMVLNYDPDGTSPRLVPGEVARLKKMWFHPDSGKENASIVKSMYRGAKREADDRNRAWISKWQYWGRKMNVVRRDRCSETASASHNRRAYC